jgi:phospholipase/lecithinase/hemolysin
MLHSTLKIALIICLTTLHATIVFGQQKTLSKGSYAITYPENWKVEDGATAKTFTLTASPDNDTDTYVENINMVVFTLGATETAKSYAQYSKTTLPKDIKQWKLIEEKGYKHKGKDAYYMIFKGVQQGTLTQWKQYYILNKGNMYVITCSADINAFKTYLPIINKMVSSFSIK